MTETHDHGGHGLTYAQALERDRAGKDAWFRSAADSPIPPAERAAFSGLPYFPIDVDLRFDGLTLQPYAGDEPSRFAIPTSDGQLRPAHRAGTFSFVVGAVPCRLTAYVLDGGHSHSLFLPFLDPTSGRETYGAGRYLDLEAEADGMYRIDFNLAYHPSCVYNPAYSCPLTPAENRLPVRIEAGERLSEDDTGH